jgi:hypothetical protein
MFGVRKQPSLFSMIFVARSRQRSPLHCLPAHLDPLFTFQDVNSNSEGGEATEGQWNGNSAYFDYKATVDKDGKTFTGKQVIKIVQGPDPYDPNATVLFTGTFNLSATKLGVDRSLLP